MGNSKLLNIFLALIVVAIAAALPFFYGCNGETTNTGSITPSEVETSVAAPATPSQQELQALVDEALQASSQLSTFKVDLNMQIAAKASSANATSQGDFTFTIKGEMDRTAPKSHVSIDMTSVILKNNVPSSSELSIETYIFPDFIYTCGIGSRWMKLPYSESAAFVNIIGQQLDVIKSITDLKFLRYETLDGIDCYVMEMTPDPVAIASWLQKNTIIGLSQEPPEEMAQAFNGLTCNVWIDKKTKLLNKQDIMLAATDKSDPGDTVEIHITMKIYDYNVPVDITLPPEAVNAS